MDAPPCPEDNTTPGWKAPLPGNQSPAELSAEQLRNSPVSGTVSSLEKKKPLGSCSANLTSDHGKELPGAVRVTGTTGESSVEKKGHVGHGMNG